jgi:hypothetical protein
MIFPTLSFTGIQTHPPALRAFGFSKVIFQKFLATGQFFLARTVYKRIHPSYLLSRYSGGLGSGVVHTRWGLLPAQRQRSDLAGGALLAEDAVGQIQGPLMRDDEVDGRHQRQALLVVTVGHRDLGVVGATDVDRVDLNAFVVAVAVLPVDRIDDLLGAEALHGPAIDHQVEALATTAAARGLAGGDLGLVLLLHGCLLDVGACETRRVPRARSLVMPDRRQLRSVPDKPNPVKSQAYSPSLPTLKSLGLFQIVLSMQLH